MEGKGEVQQPFDKEEKPSHHCLIIDPSMIIREDGIVQSIQHLFSNYPVCHINKVPDKEM